MGRNDKQNARGKRFLAQTPNNQIADGHDIEFSEEFADEDDRKAQERSRQAHKRARKK